MVSVHEASTLGVSGWAGGGRGTCALHTSQGKMSALSAASHLLLTFCHTATLIVSGVHHRSRECAENWHPLAFEGVFFTGWEELTPAWQPRASRGAPCR